MGITPIPSICKLAEGSSSHNSKIKIEMIASKMLMLCLVALTMFSLSNGEQSKEDCYKDCAKWGNMEKETVEAAVGTADFEQKFWGTDIFQYVLGNELPTTWEPIKDGACLDYCSNGSGCSGDYCSGAFWCETR